MYASKNINKKISFKDLNKLAVKEINHFHKERKPNGEVALKCLIFDVDDYLTNKPKNHTEN